MARKVADDVSTTEVVWAAAERIGKSSHAQEVNRICDYLISKNWFQTAGDLRVARENTQEWLALEVPGRLKIAIQEVLDESPSPRKPSAQGTPFSSASDEAAASHMPPGYQVDEPMAQGTTVSDEVANTAPGYEASTATSDGSQYPVYSSSGYDSSSTYDGQDDAAAHAAAWEAYYAANGYYAYSATEDATSETWMGDSYATVAAPGGEDIVEAQEVVVDDAVVADSPRETAWEDAPAGPTPATDAMAPAQQKTTWTCGQCTFINRLESAFCEVCCGHLSLSPDAHATSALEGEACADVSAEAVIVVALEETACLPVQDTTGMSIDQALTATGLEADTLVASGDARAVVYGPPRDLEPPLYVNIPSPTQPSSPLYTPSAPALEDPPTSTDEHVAHAQTRLCSLAQGGGKLAEVSAAAPTTPTTAPASSPSPSKIDYRALAFKRVPSPTAVPSGPTDLVHATTRCDVV